MTPEDQKIWEEIARTIKPLKKKKKVSTGTVSTPLTGLKPHQPHIQQTEKALPETSSSHPKESSHFQPTITEGQDRQITRKLRQGTYQIQATLDLHGQTQEEAYASLKRFIAWAIFQQFKLVLIITGKGQKKSFSERAGGDETALGVLRQNVPQWLENTAQFPGVLSVSTARPQDGGAGALCLELRSFKIKSSDIRI